jgi:hypothetical protein
MPDACVDSGVGGEPPMRCSKLAARRSTRTTTAGRVGNDVLDGTTVRIAEGEGSTLHLILRRCLTRSAANGILVADVTNRELVDTLCIG